MLAALWGSAAEADAVRVRPTAVVSGDGVTLGHVCDLSELALETAPTVMDSVVAPSPRPGQSTYVTIDTIQGALRRAGVNLAQTVISGAARCAVTRPATPNVERRAHADAPPPPDHSEPAISGRTLRDAVHETFARLAAQHGGRIDLRFARTPEQILNLSEPRHTFNVRLKGGRWLGRMVRIEVDVRAGDDAVQSIPLVVSASIIRDVVVACRPINLKATIAGDDVKLAERLYDDLEHGAVSNIDAAIGQRARRFIRAGQPIRLDDLELVPLVTRGELVDVISAVGPIEARTVARALGTGGLGDMVELRIGGRRGETLTGVVAGERRVAVGHGTSPGAALTVQLALGDRR